MRKLIVLLVALFAAAPALAQEAAAPAVPDTGSPFWNVIAYVLGIVLVPLAALLPKLIYEWQEKIKRQKEEAGSSFRDKLKFEVYEALARIAENISNKELVEIKAAAEDGKVSKDELKKLGTMAIDQAKAEFKTQGIDIGKRLGQEYLESQLRNIVDNRINGVNDPAPVAEPVDGEVDG